ncbi:hypothetical protein [Parendozoicomonas haliclonae]|uniref:Uncharacterized protein n=1 Tax=Parendozoicomonas haliclonae TaxID=1960125 RepID=A0A1X7AGG0_9GAMM|nr:hypothetical protein [Parendozoicomonas haliclonae]SMA39111.1 hypothetical protein EHSB41UT_00972 [Parendozoicomonas haliclonae]
MQRFDIQELKAFCHPSKTHADNAVGINPNGTYKSQSVIAWYQSGQQIQQCEQLRLTFNAYISRRGQLTQATPIGQARVASLKPDILPTASTLATTIEQLESVAALHKLHNLERAMVNIIASQQINDEQRLTDLGKTLHELCTYLQTAMAGKNFAPAQIETSLSIYLNNLSTYIQSLPKVSGPAQIAQPQKQCKEHLIKLIEKQLAASSERLITATSEPTRNTEGMKPKVWGGSVPTSIKSHQQISLDTTPGAVKTFTVSPLPSKGASITTPIHQPETAAFSPTTKESHGLSEQTRTGRKKRRKHKGHTAEGKVHTGEDKAVSGTASLLKTITLEDTRARIYQEGEPLRAYIQSLTPPYNLPDEVLRTLGDARMAELLSLMAEDQVKDPMLLKWQLMAAAAYMGVFPTGGERHFTAMEIHTLIRRGVFAGEYLVSVELGLHPTPDHLAYYAHLLRQFLTTQPPA